MFFRICRLFARNFRSDVGMCSNFQTERFIHLVQKDSKTTAIKSVEFQNLLKPSPTCDLFSLKSSPLIEPVGNINSRILDLPFPFSRIPVPVDVWDPTPLMIINDPPPDKADEKQAARLVVIRRRKMKKHKLRKLRKKMKFEWAKVRQRRELRKEKLFQAKLIAQMKGAEEFDAAEFVSEKLRKVQEFSELEEKKQQLKKKM